MTDTIAVFLNARAGADDADHGADAVRAAFDAHGLAADVTVLAAGDDIEAILDAVMARRPGRVVAAGGDGTINAVAARVVADGHATLGVLPLGTLNHFAKDLGIPLTLDEAVKVVADGRHTTVDVGEVNGRLFLNNASIGLYPAIVNLREQERERLGWSKWPALVKATWSVLRDPDTFESVVCVDDRELRRRTPFIFVGNNAYSVQGADLGERACLDDGELSVYVLRPKSAFGLLGLALRALCGRPVRHRDMDVLSTTGMRVDGRAGRVDVARDGEVETLDMPLQFRVLPRALRVFAPHAPCAAATD